MSKRVKRVFLSAIVLLFVQHLYAQLPTITSFTPTSGGQSTAITITGTNFTGATAVSFGGTPTSSFVIISATTIRAIPANSGSTGDISVTTPGGTATLPGFTFTGPIIT